MESKQNINVTDEAPVPSSLGLPESMLLWEQRHREVAAPAFAEQSGEEEWVDDEDNHCPPPTGLVESVSPLERHHLEAAVPISIAEEAGNGEDAEDFEHDLYDEEGDDSQTPVAEVVPTETRRGQVFEPNTKGEASFPQGMYSSSRQTPTPAESHACGLSDSMRHLKGAQRKQARPSSTSTSVSPRNNVDPSWNRTKRTRETWALFRRRPNVSASMPSSASAPKQSKERWFARRANVAQEVDGENRSSSKTAVVVLSCRFSKKDSTNSLLSCLSQNSKKDIIVFARTTPAFRRRSSSQRFGATATQ